MAYQLDRMAYVWILMRGDDIEVGSLTILLAPYSSTRSVAHSLAWSLACWLARSLASDLSLDRSLAILPTQHPERLLACSLACLLACTIAYTLASSFARLLPSVSPLLASLLCFVPPVGPIFFTGFEVIYLGLRVQRDPGVKSGNRDVPGASY